MAAAMRAILAGNLPRALKLADGAPYRETGNMLIEDTYAGLKRRRV
jgi:hypothetical protein